MSVMGLTVDLPHNQQLIVGFSYTYTVCRSSPFKRKKVSKSTTDHRDTHGNVFISNYDNTNGQTN